EDYVSLAPGTHTVTVQVRSASGPTLAYGVNFNYSSLRVAIENARTAPQMADGGRTVITQSHSLGGLTVFREITVPSTGSQDFARTVDVFTNPTANPITTTVKLVGNLGSDGATQVFATQSGNTVVEAADQWVGTDDGDGTGTPAIVHYIHGPAG